VPTKDRTSAGKVARPWIQSEGFWFTPQKRREGRTEGDTVCYSKIPVRSEMFETKPLSEIVRQRENRCAGGLKDYRLRWEGRNGGAAEESHGSNLEHTGTVSGGLRDRGRRESSLCRAQMAKENGRWSEFRNMPQETIKKGEGTHSSKGLD